MSVYQIGPGGTLTQAGISVPAGGNPTSIAVDPTGNYIYVANQIQLVALNTTPNGSYPLTYLRAYIAGTVPSFVAADPDGNFVYVGNSIFNDVFGFAISAGGTLIPAGASSTTNAGGARLLTVGHIGDTTGIFLSTGYPAPVNSASYGTPVAIKGAIRNTRNPGTIPKGSVTATINGSVVLNGTAALDGAAGFSLTFDASTQYLPVGLNIIQVTYNPGAGFEAPGPLRLAYTVTKAIPALTISPPANAIAAQPAAISVSTVQMGGRYPTGSVIFSVDGGVAGSSIPLINGAASVSYTASAGNHAITVTYSGDSYFSASTTAPIAFQAKRTTSVVVTSSSTSPVYGQSSVFTATVIAGGDVAGTVNFFDGGARINVTPVSVNSGQALFGPYALGAGNHAITAFFSGDANSLASSNAAAPLIVTVSRAAAQVSAPQLPGIAVYGLLTFSVSVAAASPGGAVPSGTVSLNDGDSTIMNATLANGVATFVVSSLSAGSHVLTGAYSGDSNYLPATSALLSLPVSKATPGLTVRSTPDSRLVSGQTVILAAILSGSAPATGTIDFYDSGARVNPAPVKTVGGQASFAYTVNSAGVHRLSAVYGGDANCNAVNGTDTPVVLAVGQAVTAISSLTSSGLTTFGQALKFTAAVSVVAPGGGTPNGLVIFRDGLVVLGTAPLDAGIASLVTSNVAAGNHTISATYGGAADFAASTPSALPFVEDKASTLTALTVSQTPVSTVLKASVGSSGPFLPGGSVQFFNGGAPLGTAALAGAGLATATLSMGAFSGTITAAYPGDANFQASTSAAVNISVIPQVATNLTMKVSPSPATIGQSVTCTLNLSWSSGPPPGGTIQLTDGSVPIANSPAGAQVVFTATLAAGNHNLTATYSGDATYLPSSARYALIVNRNAASVLLTAETVVAVFGQNVTLNAKIMTPATGIFALLAGKVAFMEGSTELSSSSLLNGVSTAVLPSLLPGTHQIAAVYSGDANWDSTGSNTVSVTVTQAATAVEISAAPGSAEHAGMSLTANLAVKPPGAGVPSGSILFVEAVTRQVLATAPVAGATATASLPADIGPKTVIAVYGGDARFLDSSSASPTQFSILNAASYGNTGFAADQIVTVFCQALTSETLTATSLPLPFILGGVNVSLTDSAASIHQALLFYVSPVQINFLIPPDMRLGPATLRITTLQGTVVSAAISVGAVSPGVFAANADGRGAASAQIVRVHSDGTQDPPENTAAYDSTDQTWTSVPIDPSSDGDELFLVVYATGIRNHSTPVTIALNGQELPVLYAGRQATYVGLDQVNVLLPPSLQHGTVELSITADGNVSNTVNIVFR